LLFKLFDLRAQMPSVLTDFSSVLGSVVLTSVLSCYNLI